MLKTKILGFELENPLVIAAGPWNRDGAGIKASIESGAGAVVTESIVSDTVIDARPRIAADSMGAQNIRLYSDIQIEGWEREMAIAKSAGGVVIASVSGHSPSEVSYLASKLEKYGADGIELSVSNPAVEALEVVAANPETLYEMTKAVVSAVKIPVAVKLSQNTTNIAKVAKAVKAANASAVTAINTVRGILGVDVETAQPSLSTYGGISGEYIRPMGLASVATIAQTVDIPICGVGGVHSAKNVLEYMMLGATTVQVGTAVMLEGRQIISKIIRELEVWAQDHNIRDLTEIRGIALNNLKSFEEMKFRPSVNTANGTVCKENCNKCIDVCLHEAITRTGDMINVDRGKCTGCGLCESVCPAKKLKLGW
ncbi:MAG: nitronate monooxygenase [Bacillota bacterium]|nr:nitronate monooxygenase [Bacillota bacterium]